MTLLYYLVICIFLNTRIMNILILGSGGREHAFAWKIAQSSHCKNLYIAPGNAGTLHHGTNLPIYLNDFEAIKNACLENKIDLVLVGPEEPLVLGIYDYFKDDESLKHIIIIAPSKYASQLEGSKSFAKEFMQRHNIPTAGYREFTAINYEEGTQYLKNHPLPIVLKADGLAAGKGVVIATTIEKALNTFKEMILDNKFGEASSKVVIEEFLDGIEMSMFVLTDGEHYFQLPSAKDYKRIGENDTGLNTGGMGAISPVPFADEIFLQKVTDRIIKPTIDGFKKENIDYKGFVFFGLIKVNDEPKVIEYNCRMGDPETEVVLVRMENDLVDKFIKMSNGTLQNKRCRESTQHASTIMLVSGGYPEEYEKGKVISGFENINDSMVFHAGTLLLKNDVVSNGGRVLAITSLGDTLEDAILISNKNASKLNFEGKYFRKDIGYEFVS
jgi:phosphoribosylamine--glycine ligase